MITMYAIPNCDTVKKAKKWLSDHEVAYDFHDYKKAGVPETLLQKWVASEGWETICNQRGMTWRKLSDTEKATITGSGPAIALMLEKPSIIKRPIIAHDVGLLVGFDAAAYRAAFL